MKGSWPFRIALAFLHRDFIHTQPWALLFFWIDSVLVVGTWYLIAHLFQEGQAIASPLGQDYFTFVLIGIALSQYLWRGFNAFADRVKADLSSGSLECFWTSPAPFPLLILLSGIWHFLMATVNATLILTIGKVAFGASLSWADVGGIIGVGFITALGMSALGLVVVSWLVASGRGDGFRPLFCSAAAIFSGAFFPLTLLPPWLQAVAVCFPLTHAFALARGTGGSWIVLIGITVGLGISGWAALTIALHQARINGRIAAS